MDSIKKTQLVSWVAGIGYNTWFQSAEKKSRNHLTIDTLRAIIRPCILTYNETSSRSHSMPTPPDHVLIQTYETLRISADQIATDSGMRRLFMSSLPDPFNQFDPDA